MGKVGSDFTRGGAGVMRMRRGGIGPRWVCAWLLGAVLPQGVRAAVNLELRPRTASVPVTGTVEIDLFAVSETGEAFTTMDVVLTWDSERMRLAEAVDSGPTGWFVFGLLPDSQRDGLNDSLSDGDAFFQAAALVPPTATPDGLLIATFRFEALRTPDPSVEVRIVPQLGQTSRTQVLQSGAVDVTGAMGTASVAVTAEAFLAAEESFVVTGREGQVVVTGDIDGVEAFGVTIVVELSPQPGATGSATFTEAPPVDITVLGNPWDGIGNVSPFDTDLSGSLSLNGLILDNATFVPAPVTFSGELGGFPVTTSADALGDWNVRLCTGDCTGDAAISLWESVPVPVKTGLTNSVLHVVDAGDGDASRTIDLVDFARLQRCFSDAGFAFDPNPAMRCHVMDFDGDGDVDLGDYRSFQQVMGGVGP
ncbi:MAG: hypothetical protein D6788_03520 [Planctomycetota bacterium]|nr:MAG: hypothetical protein D6788_03520 [Planctomycetota bacterium]